MNTIKPLVAGNWKMNGLKSSLSEIEVLHRLVSDSGRLSKADVMFCLPATLIAQGANLLKHTGLLVGGQDCHVEVSGAHTGDISAVMIADAGAQAVIVGHSERRTDHKEDNHTVLKKARAAHKAGLNAIICIGETENERRKGQTLEVLKQQLYGSVPPEGTASNTVIAYEPVWAIGTGLTPTVEDVAEVHNFLRHELASILSASEAAKTRLLYGGSVKPGNAAELMAVSNVNGALVGGASLKAEDFYGIIKVYYAS